MIKVFLVTVSLFNLNDSSLVWTVKKSPEVNAEVCIFHAQEKNTMPAEPPAYVTMSHCEVNIYGQR